MQFLRAIHLPRRLHRGESSVTLGAVGAVSIVGEAGLGLVLGEHAGGGHARLAPCGVVALVVLRYALLQGFKRVQGIWSGLYSMCSTREAGVAHFTWNQGGDMCLIGSVCASAGGRGC